MIFFSCLLKSFIPNVILLLIKVKVVLLIFSSHPDNLLHVEHLKEALCGVLKSFWGVVNLSWWIQ